MTALLAYLTKKGIMKVLKSRIFWILTIALISAMFVFISTAGFFMKYHIITKSAKIAYAAQSKIEDVRDIYSNSLVPEGADPETIFGTTLTEEDLQEHIENDNNFKDQAGDGSSGGGSGGGANLDGYEGTKDYADSISGNSILHQVHNAIVEKANSVPETWLDYSLIIGINFKEANGFGGSWIPHIGSTKKGLQDPNYNLKTRGIKDNETLEGITGTYNSKQYIGPFQTNYAYYIDNYPGNWNKSRWQSEVENSKPDVDGNGDGKSDPFNYYDALAAVVKHSYVKLGEVSRYMSFTSDQYKDDMIAMSIAARYVGVSNSKGTKRFGAANGPWTGYTHHENLNPHIQLMRKAAEEYHNNGPYYTKLKNLMNSTKSSNGTAASNIINEFYNANGWKASGTTATYTFSDGQTMKFSGQNTHYVFLVYWGGKIAQEGITETLKGSTQQ